MNGENASPNGTSKRDYALLCRIQHLKTNSCEKFTPIQRSRAKQVVTSMRHYTEINLKIRYHAEISIVYLRQFAEIGSQQWATIWNFK